MSESAVCACVGYFRTSYPLTSLSTHLNTKPPRPNGCSVLSRNISVSPPTSFFVQSRWGFPGLSELSCECYSQVGSCSEMPDDVLIGLCCIRTWIWREDVRAPPRALICERITSGHLFLPHFLSAASHTCQSAGPLRVSAVTAPRERSGLHTTAPSTGVLCLIFWLLLCTCKNTNDSRM